MRLYLPQLSFSAAYSTWLAVVMVAAVMAVVHMAACMAVPPPAWPPALPSRTFVLVVVLVLVLGDSAIGDANGALGRGRFWATAPPPSAPFRFPNPSCSVQRQSAVQRVAKIGILERGRSLGLVGLIYNTIYFVQSMMRSCPWCSCSCHFSCGVCGGCDIDLDKPQRCQRQISTSVY